MTEKKILAELVQNYKKDRFLKILVPVTIVRRGAPMYYRFQHLSHLIHSQKRKRNDGNLKKINRQKHLFF